MSEHALHLISVYASRTGWIVFGAIFIFRKNWSRDKTRKRDPMSIFGIVIQTLSLFAVWMFPRRSHTIFPLGFWFQWLTTILVIAIILVSLWTILTAEFRDHTIENPAQGDERDRAEDSLGQNVPGDRFVLEFAIENFVPEKERINAYQQNDEGGSRSQRTN